MASQCALVTFPPRPFCSLVNITRARALISEARKGEFRMGNRDWGRNEVRAVAADNNLLCALKQNDLELLLPNLGRAQHPVGDILYEPGDSVDHAYFPCRQALVSYRVVLPDGRSVETALIGREGAVGGIVSQGRLPSYARAVVQFEGQFLKVSSAAARTFEKNVLEPKSPLRAIRGLPRRPNLPGHRLQRHAFHRATSRQMDTGRA